MFCSAQGCDEITTSGERIYKGSGEIVPRDHTELVVIFVTTSQSATTCWYTGHWIEYSELYCLNNIEKLALNYGLLWSSIQCLESRL